MINWSDWYWIVGGSTSQAFSSKKVAFVAQTDTDYVAWINAGNSPTPIGDTGSLSLVLQEHLVPVLLAPGIDITGKNNASLTATYALDDQTTNDVRSVAVDSQAKLGLPGSTTGGGQSFDYHDINGTTITFQATEIENLYMAMRDYRFNLQKALQSIVLTGTGSLPPNTATI